MIGPPLLRPAPALPLAPELLTVALSACGLLVVIGGKLSLGRSFGLMPANRGVVSSGLYRIVRHPIYLGYLDDARGVRGGEPDVVERRHAGGRGHRRCCVRAVCEERTLARDRRVSRVSGRRAVAGSCRGCSEEAGVRSDGAGGQAGPSVGTSG